MVKYTSNAWHAVKIVFANEIGNLCKRIGVDSHDVMDIFCSDDEAEPVVDLPEARLRLRRLVPAEGRAGAPVPRQGSWTSTCHSSTSLLDSNQLPVQRAIERIVETGKRKVGLLGFSFKAGTDDLRESPLVILAEALLGKGFELAIYDRNVSLARLVGANRRYIDHQIPHLSRHLCESIEDVVTRSEVVVIGNAAPEFSDAIALCRPDQIVIDLVRIPLDFGRVRAQYDGLCW